MLTFMGDVGLMNVVSEFLFGHPIFFLHPKMGTLVKSAQINVPKNGILGAGTKILRALL